MHRYLKDFENRIRQKWSDGNEWTDEAKAVMQCVIDLRELELSDIEKFYEEPEEETDDGDDE